MKQNNKDEPFVGSSNFESQKVVLVDNDTLRINPTIGSLGFGALFALIGLGLVGFWAAATFGSLDDSGGALMLIVGLAFVAVGLLIYRGSNKQVVINKEVGVAFIKSWSPAGSLDRSAVIKHLEPDEIVAIQSTSRVVESRNRKNRKTRKTAYTQHQVNILTSDEKRHNVFVTLKPENADNVANSLAALFNLPLRNG